MCVPRQIFREIANIIEPNLSLDILINYILIKKKSVYHTPSIAWDKGNRNLVNIGKVCSMS